MKQIQLTFDVAPSNLSQMTAIGCYKIRDAASGGVLYGQFHVYNKRSFLMVSLSIVEDVNPSGLVDALVQATPLMILDHRNVRFVNKNTSMEQILVVNEAWFVDWRLICRPGMNNIFRIRQQWTEGFDSRLENIKPGDFPFVQPMGNGRGMNMHDLYCFRQTLCKEFQRSLKRCKATTKSVSFLPRILWL